MKMRWMLLGLIACMLAGCSLIRPSKTIDVKPFAESTINLVAEVNYGLDSRDAVYLRRYAQGERLAVYRAKWDYYRPILRGVGIYSLGLVSLSRSNLTGEERADHVADLLERIFQDALRSGHSRLSLSSEQLNAIFDDIREQKSLLNALGAAQPIVDEVARFSGEYLDDIKDTQDELQVWLAEVIDGDYVDLLAFEERAKSAQRRHLHSLVLLSDERQLGVEGGLDELFQRDAELEGLVDDPSAVRPEELQLIEDHLVKRLARIQDLKEQFAFDLDTYYQTTRELDQLVKHANDNLRRTRLTIFVWAGAHRQLAEGITNPAKVDLMGVAKKALDAAVPL